MAWATYRVVAEIAVTYADSSVPRYASTGVARGAEPRDLGDPRAAGAVLLVHGFVGGGSNFSDLPEALAALGWRVRVMRLPGHGTSPRELARTPLDVIQGAVVAELLELRRTHHEVVVVGHSMGGTLATLAVAEAGADRLVLAAPYFRVQYRWFYILPPEIWVETLMPALGWAYKGEIFEQVARQEAHPLIYSYTWVPAEALQMLVDAGARAGRAETLARIECPVLLVHSRGDVAAAVDAARAAVDAMPSADKQELILVRSNHHVFFDHERDQVRARILEFIGAPRKP